MTLQECEKMCSKSVSDDGQEDRETTQDEGMDFWDEEIEVSVK